MIYLGLKFYLRKHLLRPSVNFKWTEEDNTKIFAYIHENFSDKYLAKGKNRLEIKQAFIDFFEPVGYILFRLKDDTINLRVFPYKMKPQESKYIDTLVQMIEHDEELIHFNYNSKADQILIDGKLRRNLYNFVEHIEDEHINKKELIKYVVRKALKLEEADLVLNKKRKIFIKLFKFTKRKDIIEGTNTQANRYNGYTKEELEELYYEYFDKDSINVFLEMIANTVFEDIFFHKRISNKQYEKNIYSIIQTLIAQELVEFTDKNIEFRKGFAGFMFRINFLYVFKHISNNVLKHISMREDFILDWLKYYDGKVFVDDGVKYLAPELITPDGERWNPVVIYSNISVWFKIREKIVFFNERLKSIDKTMQTLEVEGKTPLDYKNHLLEEQQYCLDFVHTLNQKISNLIDEKHMTKDTQRVELIKKNILILRTELKEYEKDIEEIDTEILHIKSQSQYKKLLEEKSHIYSDLKREEKLLEKNFKTYNSIQSALIKAMTSKRIAV